MVDKKMVDKNTDLPSKEIRSFENTLRAMDGPALRRVLLAAVFCLSGSAPALAVDEPSGSLPTVAQAEPAQGAESASIADTNDEPSPSSHLTDQEVADIIYSALVASVAGGDYPLFAWRIYTDVADLSKDAAAAKFALDYARQAKNTEKALLSAYQWVALAPGESEPIESLVHTLMLSGLVDEAVVYFDKILRRMESEGRSRGDALKESLSILIEAENPDVAAQVLMRHIEKYDGRRDHWALLALGTMLQHFQRPQAAIGALEEARSIYLASLDAAPSAPSGRDDSKDASESASESASEVEAQGETEGAAEGETEGETQSAAQKGDQITVPLARLLHANGRSDEALSILEEFIERSPDNHGVRIIYGHTLFESGRRVESRAVFDDIVAKNPKNINARYALAILLLQSNQIDEAAEQFKFISEEGQTSEVYAALFYLARIAEIRGEFIEAISLYRRVRQGDNRFNAQMRVVDLLAEHRDVGLARNHLRTIRPRTWQDMLNIVQLESKILVNAELYEDALEVYDKAIDRFNGSTRLLYQRGVLAIEHLDRLDILERDMRAILKIDPNNVDALNTLGYSLANGTDRYEEAHELIARALKLDPDNQYILDSMGWTLYRMGQPENALEYLRRAMTKKPEAEIAAHLGEVLWALDRKDEARRVWEAALRMNPDDKSLLDALSRFDL